MKLKYSTIAVLGMISLVACEGDRSEYEKEDKIILLDKNNIDTTVSPGDNFFRYANGGWLNTNEIPESETRWGTFDMLAENNMMKVHTLLEDAAHANGKKGSNEQKVGDFYKTGMDSVEINKAALTPIKPTLDRIDAIQNTEGVLKEIAKLHTEGIGQVFGFYISPDDKDVTQQITQLFQGGLGMPDRDYYFNKDTRSTNIREAYKAYQVELLRLMGMDSTSAKNAAAEIYALEGKLAKASMTRTEMRDPYKVYNKFSIQEFSKQTPGMDWKTLLADMKVKGEDSMIVGMPAFMKEVSKQLKATPLETWKKYLKFHVVNDMSPYLNEEVDKAHFNFYGKIVRGQQEQKPRWKRVLQVVDGGVGELLGQLYVEQHFKPEAKKRMEELVKNLQETYRDRIMKLDWMTDETKQKAVAKLNTFVKKIGYPDKWRNYDKLDIVGDSYVENVIASAKFDYNYMVNKLGKPVDKTEWFMTPPTVNAYYNPAFNEIVFPAGILAFPFFDMDADDAVNYGAIGGVIGHEMTHGFDDQGSKYAADGNLSNWWTPEDSMHFEEKTKVVREQFDNYTVLDTVHVNGQLTLGENLADLGGLAIAYEAFQKTEQAKKGEKIDGLTPDQRFFLSWAQVWRANTRDEEAANRIITDPHSPVEWRTNGPLSNMPEFYKAFDIKEGDKMWRPDSLRAKVW